ncbi:hypothetical protein C8J56DRAFT_786482 [Mycena floridula]|nr:hypothetical protein C8J56DRAFT_786482 [Mycena floridula]
MITPFGRAFYECKANFWVFPYVLLLCINIFSVATSAAYWSVCAVSAAQVLQQLDIYLPQFRLFDSRWYEFGVVYLIVAVLFVVVLTLQAIIALLWVIATKWIVIGRRKPGGYDWDKSSYCQRWKLHLMLSREALNDGYGGNGNLGTLARSAYIAWFYRALGAQVGKDCAIFASGKPGLMIEIFNTCTASTASNTIQRCPPPLQ